MEWPEKAAVRAKRLRQIQEAGLYQNP